MDQLDAIFGSMKAGMDNVGNKAAGEFKGLCVKCLTNITDDDFSKNGDQMFHSKCFKCNKCGTDLKNKAFYYTADSQLWCEPDYVANTYVKCASCEKNIVDEVVEYDNKSYHTTCFVCDKCKLPLAGIRFVPHEGKFLCVDDYQNLTAFPCKKCGEKITTSSGVTEVLKVGEDRYHPRCFCCTTCETPFINNKANQHQGKFYCDTHFTLAKAGKTSLMQ